MVCWGPAVSATCTVVEGGVVACTATVGVGTVDVDVPVGTIVMGTVAEGGGGACTCTGAEGPPVAWTATFAVGAVPGGAGVTCTAALADVGAV